MPIAVAAAVHINQSVEHKSSTVNGDEARSQIAMKSKWKETKNRNRKNANFGAVVQKISMYIINSLVSRFVVATARHENERMRVA